MDVSKCLSFGVRVLKNPLEAEVLLSFLIGKPREFLLAHPEEAVQEEKMRAFESCVRKREQGIPLAYLTHHKEFYGLDFYVDERVLIPRPETELLVDVALGYYRQFGFQNATILDIGTGSGNIAISLAKSIPSAKIIATDISKDAIEVARQNAGTHGVSQRVEFFESDLLSNINFEIDGIVANLPYIGTEKFNFVEDSVKRYEPEESLFGGFDGLRVYERLFQQIYASKFVKHTKIFENLKFLCVEIGFQQRETLESMLNKYFDRNMVNFHQDLAGIDRACSILLNV